MAIFDLYSKRIKRQTGEIIDVFSYDNIPQPLKVQIVHIIKDAFGKSREYQNNVEDAYKFVSETLCREYGIFKLDNSDRYSSSVVNYFLHNIDNDKSIDLIELCFNVINKIVREDNNYRRNTDQRMSPDDAINELNVRFREHGVGYAFESNEIIRIDSTLVHSEITKPVLNLLNNINFKGANDEYLRAHEHYRHGNNKECLAECLKAFESTIKIICKSKGWSYNETDTSKRLIAICFENNLIPLFLQSQFSALRSIFESGVPTIRNRLGGHGQGDKNQIVDDSITSFTMNLTGSNILYLIQLSDLMN